MNTPVATPALADARVPIVPAGAAGLISDPEAQALRAFDRKVMNLVNVDDFAPHELGTQARADSERTGAATALA